MNDCLVVLTDDVDAELLIEETRYQRNEVSEGAVTEVRTNGGRVGEENYDTYDYVTCFEFEWLRLCAFGAEPFAIYKGTI